MVRYIDIESCTIFERFLSFTHATSLTAAGISSFILGVLQDNGLDTKGLVSQGYDGASVMSGKNNGVQKLIKDVAPQAMYMHCHAHCLNLVLVDCAKHLPDVDEFFQLLQLLYVFLSASKAHEVYVSTQLELHPGKQIRQIQRLSETRWACRFAAVDTVCSTFDSIIATLEAIGNGTDKAKSVEAKGILFQIHSIKFVVSLVVFSRILSCTKRLSDQLQSKDIDISKAVELVSATIETLQEFRDKESRWDEIVKYTQDVVELHDIHTLSSHPRRRRVASRRHADAIILETTGVRDNDVTYEGLRRSIYIPIIDCMLSELNQRFAGHTLDIMQAIQSCNPKASSFLDPQKLLPIVNAYNLSKDMLAEECPLAKRTLVSKSISSVYEIFVELAPLRNAFPTLLKLLQIVLTVAVSSASCERTFSSLKRIKTWLRTTMTEQRLTDLAINSIERDISSQLSTEQVLEEFAASDNNRRIILS